MRLTKGRVAQALNATGAIVADTTGVLGVSRQALYKFMERHPDLRVLRTEIEEELLDIAESNVIAAIRAGDMKTVRWFLERKGKDRGYSTRQETTGADGGPLEFGVVERRVVDPVIEEDRNDASENRS